MQYIEALTMLNSAMQEQSNSTTNSTFYATMGSSVPDTEGGMVSKTYQYILTMYPILVSLGFGTIFSGIVYTVLKYFSGWIQRKLYCSVVLHHEDDTFLWMNKYL